MKKFLTFLTLLTLFFTVGWAADVTFTAGTDVSNTTSISKDGVTVSVTSGTFSRTDNYRIYAGNSMTISSSSTISKIVLTTTSAAYGCDILSLNENSSGSFTGSGTTCTWTGSSTSITFDASSQARIKTIVVTIQGSSTPTTYSLTLPQNLEGGTVSATGADDLSEIEAGTTITVTATPSSGYSLEWMKSNGTNVSNPYVFQIQDDTEITAHFKLNETPSGGTQTATFVAGVDKGTTTDQSADQMSKGDVTFTSTSAALGRTDNYRLYTGSTNTFSVPAGYKITKIVFSSENGTQNLLSVLNDVGSYDATNGVWTGEAQTVSFKPSAQARFETITVYYTSSGSPSVSDLYIVGQVNGLDAWSATKAVKMTYDGSKYTAKFYVTGVENSALNNQGQGTHGGTFVFATKIGSWDNINGNRYEPELSNGDSNWWLATSGATNSGNLLNRNWNNSFLIPAGLYEIEVSGDLSTYNLKTIKDLTPAFDPASGEVNVGSSTTLATAEDFNAFIASCNAFEGTDANVTVVTPEVKLYINNTEASTYNFATAGEVTLTGKAALVAGSTEYASKTTTGTYTAVQKYSATIASGITGGSVSFKADGVQTALNNLTEGYGVRVYVTPNTDYELATLTYTVEGENPVDFKDSYNNEYYTFNMPAANVTINATFNYTGVETQTTYQLITSNDDLEVNGKYIIVSKNAGVALGLTQASNTGKNITITNDATVISSTSGVSEFVLGSADNGKYTFKNGNYYLENSSSTTVGTSTNENYIKWSVNISSNGNATMINEGQGTIEQGKERYLRYRSTSNDFRAYQATPAADQADVQLFKEVTPETKTLAELCANGVDGKVYTISDENGLRAAYKNGNTVWFKDEIEKTFVLANETLTIIGGSVNLDVPGDEQNYWIENKRTKDFDQSNWIEVVFPENLFPGGLLHPGTDIDTDKPYVKVKNLTGIFTKENGRPRLEVLMAVASEDVTVTEKYEPNPYIPANFYGSQPGYFFSKPKVQEYAKVVDAQWNGTKMVMGDNNAGFVGSFTIKPVEGLKKDYYYTFHGIISRSIDGGQSYQAPRLQDVDYDMETIDLAGQQGSEVTSISTVGVNGEVKSVKYVSVAGVVSDRPFQGVNIVVTEYTDGSRTTAKVVK